MYFLSCVKIKIIIISLLLYYYYYYYQNENLTFKNALKWRVYENIVFPSSQGSTTKIKNVRNDDATVPVPVCCSVSMLVDYFTSLLKS